MGRYLEHGRIYSFFDGVHTRIYIASGDFLTRTTECRVEVGVRVEDPRLVQKLTDILQLQLRDNVNAREMQADGSYQKVKPAEGEPVVNGQMGMYELLRNDWCAVKAPDPAPEKPAAQPEAPAATPLPEPEKAAPDKEDLPVEPEIPEKKPLTPPEQPAAPAHPAEKPAAEQPPVHHTPAPRSQKPVAPQPRRTFAQRVWNIFKKRG